jgi:hypothetical protein
MTKAAGSLKEPAGKTVDALTNSARGTDAANKKTRENG